LEGFCLNNKVNLNLREMGFKYVDSSGSGQEPVAGCCEHGNERLGCGKDCNFLTSRATASFLKTVPFGTNACITTNIAATYNNNINNNTLDRASSPHSCELTNSFRAKTALPTKMFYCCCCFRHASSILLIGP
jgi:hypothetical protein